MVDAQLKRRQKQVTTLLKGTRGAFAGLLRESKLPITVNEGGHTFAVSAPFAYFDVVTGNNSFRKEEVNLYLPSWQVFLKNPLSHEEETAICRAGGWHEGGHGLFHSARRRSPHFDNDYYMLLRRINRSEYWVRNNRSRLFRWCNILGDGQLEQLLKRKYPLAKAGFATLQEWCWGLEASNRASGSMMLQCVVRDLIKDHDSPSRDQVMSEYNPKAVKLARDLEPMWAEFRDTPDENVHGKVGGCYAIVLRAIEILATLEDMGQKAEEEPPQPPQQPQKPQHGEGEGEDEGGSESTPSDSEEDDSEDGEGGEGGEGEDDSEDGEGEGEDGEDGEGDSEGEGEDGEDGEGDSEGDSEGDAEGDAEGGSEGDSEDDSEGDSEGDSESGSESDAETPAEETSSKGFSNEPPSKEEIMDAIEQEALDPSSAFKKALDAVGGSAGIAYTPNGSQMRTERW